MVTFQPTKITVEDSPEPVRRPERRAKPKAGAQASRDQTVGLRESARAVGGGLGNTANIAAAHAEKVSLPTRRGRRRPVFCCGPLPKSCPIPKRTYQDGERKTANGLRRITGSRPRSNACAVVAG